MARPKVEIDWEAFDKLCNIHCTLIEIADWFSCSEDTIERAVKREKKMSFADYYKKKSGRGKISLRRKMFDIAQSGNVTMLIWLSKNLLGFTDKVDQNVSEESHTHVTYDTQFGNQTTDTETVQPSPGTAEGTQIN